MKNLIKKNKVSCKYCKRTLKHLDTCIIVSGVEGINKVTCKICGYIGKSLSIHLKIKHNINKENYNGKIICDESQNKYSIENKNRKNWITKLKKENPELYKQKIEKMSKKISNTVMSNDKERKRRSELMANLWPIYKEHFINVAKQTAIKTSQNPEILKQRSEQLKKWRENNKEAFYELCTSKMIKYGCSKPEKELRKILQASFPNLNFKGNGSLYHKSFSTKTNRRQIDISNFSEKIIIEFDGPVHFKNIPNWNQLEIVKKRDEEINALVNENYLIIRISQDEWNYNSEVFNKDLINVLNCLLKNYKTVNREIPYTFGASYRG